MLKHNADNERTKRKYFVFLKEAKRQSEASVDAVAKAISRFERYTNWRDFKRFHLEQAVGFKAHLGTQKNLQSGKPLSKATMNSTLRALKAFFQWVSMQPGYKSRLVYSDMEYFNLSEKDARVATAKRQQPVPSIEQIRHALFQLPETTLIERRNRALFAFVLLTGARDSAVASLKLKHIDLEAGSVFQDAREVNTKASKTFTTYFFPVGDDVRAIVEEWVVFLRKELLWSGDDPVFPKTRIGQSGEREFEAVGVLREHWSTADPIRKLFRATFETAGLPYFNPHSFRKTLVGLGERVCRTPEEFKAWSQNLGHEGVLTTFYSYGEVQPARQSDIFKELQRPREVKASNDTAALAKAVAMELAAHGQYSLSP